mmetsp:Transcript_20890/g.52791  ORF Transcript_20890/g.52791 Transcript_20890/m.52791 type:complete len:145 (-) Transcript_20890:526-960(-)
MQRQHSLKASITTIKSHCIYRLTPAAPQSSCDEVPQMHRLRSWTVSSVATREKQTTSCRTSQLVAPAIVHIVHARTVFSHAYFFFIADLGDLALPAAAPPEAPPDPDDQLPPASDRTTPYRRPPSPTSTAPLVTTVNPSVEIVV